MDVAKPIAAGVFPRLKRLQFYFALRGFEKRPLRSTSGRPARGAARCFQRATSCESWTFIQRPKASYSSSKATGGPAGGNGSGTGGVLCSCEFMMTSPCNSARLVPGCSVLVQVAFQVYYVRYGALVQVRSKLF